MKPWDICSLRISPLTVGRIGCGSIIAGLRLCSGRTWSPNLPVRSCRGDRRHRGGHRDQSARSGVRRRPVSGRRSSSRASAGSDCVDRKSGHGQRTGRDGLTASHGQVRAPWCISPFAERMSLHPPSRYFRPNIRDQCFMSLISVRLVRPGTGCSEYESLSSMSSTRL